MKLQVPFIQLPVLFDAAALAAEVSAIPDACWRGHPSGLAGNSALTLITANGDPDDESLSGPMQPTPSLLACPYLTQVLHALGATWGRSRLMRLSGQAEVTPHVDLNYYWRERMRVHVPITTTPSVRFQCGEAETHMAQGECWLFDTWRMHRVLNEGSDERIHLVADTVGGEGFWDLVSKGRTHGPAPRTWQPRLVAPDAAVRPQLDLESFNLPAVMTPWELREHIVFLLSDAGADANLASIQQALLLFSRRWHGLWSIHGDRREGWPRYRDLLERTRADLLERGIDRIGLRNEMGLWDTLRAHVLDVALADGKGAGAQVDRHGSNAPAEAVTETETPAAVAAQDPGVQAGTGAAVITRSASRGSAARFDRPVFIVSPPRSGSTLLFESLSRAPGLHTIGDESHQLIEGVPGLAPSQRLYDSNRLTAHDATPEVSEALRERFRAALRDREGKTSDGIQAVRMLEKTPKNALRIPFLKAVFPDARFVYLHRDPRQVLASMIDGWESGHFQMYPQLPGWTGPVWSFLLVPDWRELIGAPLAQVVARQWESATKIMLDDLDALDRDDWTGIDHGRFVASPQAQAERICSWAGLDWDVTLEQSLPLSRYTLTPPDPDKWRRHAAQIEPRLATMQAIVQRAAAAAAA